jgi:hypothetical protein
MMGIIFRQVVQYFVVKNLFFDHQKTEFLIIEITADTLSGGALPRRLCHDGSQAMAMNEITSLRRYKVQRFASPPLGFSTLCSSALPLASFPRSPLLAFIMLCCGSWLPILAQQKVELETSRSSVLASLEDNAENDYGDTSFRSDLFPSPRFLDALRDDWRRRYRADTEGKPIETDRPDFTEASSTVPQGWLQLESGYTFTYDIPQGQLRRVHTAPEFLLRYGMTDSYELRLAWTYQWESVRDSSGATTVTDGAEDLVVGVKLALSEQRRVLPEAAVIVQLGIPTGARAFSHNHIESGVNFLYGWEITPQWSVAGSTGFETGTELILASTPSGQFPLRDQVIVVHQSITTGRSITDRLGSYFEYFVLDVNTGQGRESHHFLNGGFIFLVDENTQWDIRAGWGLNESADDLFAGVGYSIRR